MRNPNDSYSRNTLNVWYGFDNTSYPNYQLIKALKEHLSSVNPEHPDLDKTIQNTKTARDVQILLPTFNKTDQLIANHRNAFSSDAFIEVGRYSTGAVKFKREKCFCILSNRKGLPVIVL